MDEQKDKIVRLAHERFKQYGIRSVSIDDLCRELGMSKKTFYVYFRQKDDLIIDVLKYMHARHKEESDKMIKGKSALECVKKMIELPAKLDSVHKEPPFAYDLQKYYPEIYTEHINVVRKNTLNFITAHLKQGIQEGVYRADLDIEMCAIFYVTIQQAYIMNVNKVHNVSPKRIMSFALDTFLRTVLSEEGKKQINLMLNNKQTI